MSPPRILHTSDLHLGKRFGTMPEGIRHRLVEARHGAIGALAAAARGRGIGHILLAGDTFDTETPPDTVRVQALAAMAEDPALTWWLLPGNHDSLAAEPLWDALRRDAPPNVRLLDTAEPRALAPGLTLLPAPVPSRFPGHDPTDALAQAETPPGEVRIGLAHGPVTSFHEDADTSAVIPPDRADSAGLAYLALGDWHGMREVGPSTRYSGTPERDRFRHDGRGLCLAVTPGGSVPEVEEIETGRFDWRDTGLDLTPGVDAAAALEDLLPPPALRRDCVWRLALRGTVPPEARAALLRAAARAGSGFGHLEVDADALATEVSAGDLDAIAPSGALRAAADELAAAARDDNASEDERRIAARALDRLWTLVQGAA